MNANMNTKKKSYLIYFDFAKDLDLLTDEEAGVVLKSLTAYAKKTAETGEDILNFLESWEMPLTVTARMILYCMADAVYRDTAKWHAVQQARRTKWEKRQAQEE